jgi:hypothetical protein
MQLFHQHSLQLIKDRHGVYLHRTTQFVNFLARGANKAQYFKQEIVLEFML